jgi:hypothetical protein
LLRRPPPSTARACFPAYGASKPLRALRVYAAFLCSIFTQDVQGHTALATGIALLPQGIIMGIGTYAGQKLTGIVPLKVMVVLGFAILAVSTVFLLFLEQGSPLWVTALILSGRAIAIGLVTSPLLVEMLAPPPENELPDGNTLFNITQRLGGSIGVSILGSIVGAGGSPSADGRPVPLGRRRHDRPRCHRRPAGAAPDTGGGQRCAGSPRLDGRGIARPAEGPPEVTGPPATTVGIQ